MNGKTTVVLAAALLTAIALAAQPGFDPKDVVRRVRQRQTPHGDIPHFPIRTPHSGLDDGEFLIDTSVVCVPARLEQCSPAVAFDGSNFLVVWEDGRGDCSSIYGARVTLGGVVLDSDGVVISSGDAGRRHPAVAFDGTNHLVVWRDERSDSSSDIYGTRVNRDGIVLDPGGIAISTAPLWQDYPAVAFDAANFVVVWSDYRNGRTSDIYGARVTPGGTVLDPDGIAISTEGNNEYWPAVACDGANYLVVWQDGRNGPPYRIFGARVSHGGIVLDSAGFAVSTAEAEEQRPAVSFDGINYLTVWEDARGGHRGIYGARVSQNGAVLDSDDIAVSTASGFNNNPAVSFDGTDFMVVWQFWHNDTGGTHGARVTQSGHVLDSTAIAVSTSAVEQSMPAVAQGGAGFLVVWSDDRNRADYGDIYGTRLTPDGTPLDSNGIAVSTGANDQYEPAVAFDGTNFLVVWRDWRIGSGYDIFGIRLSPNGIALDSVSFAIADVAGDQYYPAVAFDGTDFLVAWEDWRNGLSDIYAARVAPQGTVLDPDGIPVSTATNRQYVPAVAFDGANFLVSWEDNRSGSHWDIYAARVSPEGSVLDPDGIPVSTAMNDQYVPAIAFDGVNFLVTWNDYRSGSYSDIYAARVTPQGTVLDPGGIPVSTATDHQYVPAVAFNGTNFLVVWTDYRGGSYSDIYAARVAPQGTVLDSNGIPVSTATNYQEYPAVAFDGANFLVTWEDYRNGDTSDIYAARVSPAGNMFDAGPVVRQEGDQLNPALARGPGNQMFLVYQGWAGTVGGKTYNTDRIWGKFGPFPGVAESRPPTAYSSQPLPTIVRGVLELPRKSGTVPAGLGTVPIFALLDISGRKVLDLHPGPNDVSRLASGVYFVSERLAVSGRRLAASRVLILN
jgi:hypothetical protein